MSLNVDANSVFRGAEGSGYSLCARLCQRLASWYGFIGPIGLDQSHDPLEAPRGGGMPRPNCARDPPTSAPWRRESVTIRAALKRSAELTEPGSYSSST